MEPEGMANKNLTPELMLEVSDSSVEMACSLSLRLTE